MGYQDCFARRVLSPRAGTLGLHAASAPASRSNLMSHAAQRFSGSSLPKQKTRLISARPHGLFGCRVLKTGNVLYPLDFIEFRAYRAISIFDEISPLYDKGLSITEIHNQTGYGRTAIWEALKKHGVSLRPQSPVSFQRWRQGRGTTRARPPYGFCYFQGEVIRDPKEYPTFQLILSLWKQGTSLSDIQRTLAKKKIKSRTGKPWSYNVIKALVTRSYKNLPAHLQPQAEGKQKNKNTNKENEG